MPKHVFGPAREKIHDIPSEALPGPNAASIQARSPHAVPSPASVEVLLRSKIAQLEGKGKGVLQPGGDASGDCAGKGGGRGGARRIAAGDAGKGRTTAHEEDYRNDVMKQFERQVSAAAKARIHSSECAPSNSGGVRQCRGFTTEIVQALKEMYAENVRRASTMNKQAEVLSRKTSNLEKSNQKMRNETELCAKEAIRLENAVKKLEKLAVELDARRKEYVEARLAQAAEASRKRDGINAQLNAVVAEITGKIQEQEKERIAQDKENAELRGELQALLQSYEVRSNASDKALKAQAEEKAVLAKRLEELTAAAEASALRESALKTEVEELVASDGVLQGRVGEHKSRLQRQEAGLRASSDAIKKLQDENSQLSASVAHLSAEKEVLLARACIGNSRASVEGSEGSGGIGMSEQLQWMAEEKAKRVAELECVKDQLQTRCRELQAERTRLTVEVKVFTEETPPTQGEIPLQKEENVQDEGTGVRVC